MITRNMVAGTTVLASLALVACPDKDLRSFINAPGWNGSSAGAAAMHNWLDSLAKELCHVKFTALPHDPPSYICHVPDNYSGPPSNGR